MIGLRIAPYVLIHFILCSQMSQRATWIELQHAANDHSQLNQTEIAMFCTIKMPPVICGQRQQIFTPTSLNGQLSDLNSTKTQIVIFKSIQVFAGILRYVWFLHLYMSWELINAYRISI